MNITPRPIIFVLIGQLRTLRQSRSQLEKLSKVGKVWVYTDHEGYLNARHEPWVDKLVNLDQSEFFNSLMSNATSEAAKRKLFQWARLESSLLDLQNELQVGSIPADAVFVKIRSDITLRGLRKRSVLGLDVGKILAKTDWAFAIAAGDLERMRGLWPFLLEWSRSRHPIRIKSENLSRIELGTLRFNWPGIEGGSSIQHFLHSRYPYFARLGRAGEWLQRGLIRLNSRAPKLGNKEIQSFASPGRVPLDSNWLASETLFAAYVIENFDRVESLFPIWGGRLRSNRKPSPDVKKVS